MGGAGPTDCDLAWDAENRLVSVTPHAPVSGSRRVEYAYDYRGRRIERRAYAWDPAGGGGSGAWSTTPSAHTRFVWFGWLNLLELDALASNAYLRKQTWGLDLAGLSASLNSLDAAGGIGGLLAVRDWNGTASTSDDKSYIYFYDGNGNVREMVDSATNAVAAHYEYDPYGAVVAATGAYAGTNAWRFSTKQFDAETGLGYWGYRWYDARMGRWTNRDPAGYRDSGNLYLHARNVTTGLHDALGLQASQPTCDGACGLEIGSRLKEAMSALTSVWNNHLTNRQRGDICAGILQHAEGWDIYELAWQKYLFASRTCGTGSCQDTVQVYGRCYKAHHVNYALWGNIRRLCKADLSQTLQAVTLHRLTTQVRGDDDPDLLRDEVNGRQLWAYLGYKGELSASDNKYVRKDVGLQKRCRSCSDAYTGPLTISLRSGSPVVGSGTFLKIYLGPAGYSWAWEDTNVPADFAVQVPTTPLAGGTSP